jgi:hypothetical protein
VVGERETETPRCSVLDSTLPRSRSRSRHAVVSRKRERERGEGGGREGAFFFALATPCAGDHKA